MKRKTLTDPDGNRIETKYLAQDVLKRELLMEKVFSRIEKLSEKMLRDKEKIKADVDKYLQFLAKSLGSQKNWQSNTTLYNFSQTCRIDINISNTLAFDEKLQLAKEKIDNCIAGWAVGSNQKILAIVKKAFSSKRGNVDTMAVLKLRTLKFPDPEWKEAMDLIMESILIKKIKTYFVFKTKNENEEWVQVPLNFSRM